jgi:signal transduction histidine kinase
VGSAIAGALWGLAAIVMFPVSPPHQALLIVCLFSVVLGGLNLTAVYKPSFYSFVLAVLVPLVARVAIEGDQFHLFTALVLLVVLVFVLSFGRQVNLLFDASLAIRYANVDDRGTDGASHAAESARAAAEPPTARKSQFPAPPSHDLRQPLHAMGLFRCAVRANARSGKPLAAASRRPSKRSKCCSGSYRLSDSTPGWCWAWRRFARAALCQRRRLAPQAAACGLVLRRSIMEHSDDPARADPA